MLPAWWNKERKESANRSYGRTWLSRRARSQEFMAGCQAGVRLFLLRFIPVLRPAEEEKKRGAFSKIKATSVTKILYNITLFLSLLALFAK